MNKTQRNASPIGIITVLVFLSFLTGCSGFVPTSKPDADLSDPTLITTQAGLIKGEKSAGQILVWKGVPYAKPPLRDLRWKAPQNPELWGGIRETKTFSKKCSQVGGLSGGMKNTSEDCLYLNIWKPGSEEKNLPVYVWIHGGANVEGSGSGTNGEHLAQRANMIVISLNYRLGPLGWLTHPALMEGKNDLDDSGNYGTLDLIKALEWVRENIAAFGGDPGNVTIAGESAGGWNVQSLVVSPLAKGLFHRAISQSGPSSNVKSKKLMQKRGETIVHRILDKDGLKAEDVADLGKYLRGKSLKEIFSLYEQGFPKTTNLVSDGVVIKTSIIKAIESGNYNKVPMIVGGNSEESKFFIALQVRPFWKYWIQAFWMGGISIEDFNFPELDRELSDLYDTPVDARQFYEDLASYGSMMWTVVCVDQPARSLRRHADQPDIYAYQFRWGGKSATSEGAAFFVGSAHAMEIPFFFGNFSAPPFASFKPDNLKGRKALSDVMIKYLKQFVHTGNPNQSGDGLPDWKPWIDQKGDAKKILFDANENEAIVTMSNDELTMKEVMSEIEALPDYVGSAVLSSSFVADYDETEYQ